MKMNPDLIREILIFVEENTGLYAEYKINIGSIPKKSN